MIKIFTTKDTKYTKENERDSLTAYRFVSIVSFVFKKFPC